MILYWLFFLAISIATITKDIWSVAAIESLRLTPNSVHTNELFEVRKIQSASRLSIYIQVEPIYIVYSLYYKDSLRANKLLTSKFVRFKIQYICLGFLGPK